MAQDVVSLIQDLIRVNMDSAKGFLQAADTINNEPIARLFRKIADDRRHQAQELRTLVDMSDDEVHDYGSIQGALRRWWISAKQALTDGDDHAVLEQCEHGEQDVKRKYEEALRIVGESVIHQLLSKQYVDVARTLDAIRGMRDISTMN
ncbi:MAG TPA: PA2169 family four-helix-bundle protein [Phycisphaerales bacterium]|nr:PA2169 family four-helix-bundle protein [Phycisphaerales bacterium]